MFFSKTLVILSPESEASGLIHSVEPKKRFAPAKQQSVATLISLLSLGNSALLSLGQQVDEDVASPTREPTLAPSVPFCKAVVINWKESLTTLTFGKSTPRDR